MVLLLLPLLLMINLTHVYCLPLQAISNDLYGRATKVLGNDLSIYFLSSPYETDKKFLPEIANGHIGTQIRHKCIFVNGLYNGLNITSHRACIPSLLDWEIKSQDKLISRIITLDSLIGVTTDVYIYSNYNISISTYVSRDFRQILMKNVSLEMSGKNNRPITVQTTKTNFNFTGPDIDFQFSENRNICVLKGLTKVPENNYTNKLPIFLVYDDIPATIVLSTSNPWRSFVLAIDTDLQNTTNAFNKANQNKEKLLYNHAEAWIDTWDDGIVQITNSDPFLMQSVHMAQYYILSSLPFKNWVQTEPWWSFYGVSPGGLAHGEGEEDYMGHVFWDMDTWIYPAFLFFHRDSAIAMMKYRLMMLNSAIQHSNDTGYKGARYPWESAKTGFETTPSKTCAINEVHVTGDISYAVEQLLWLEPKSSSLLYDLFATSVIPNISKFWESRITRNRKTNKLEILNVMPPDEYVRSCNNSAFTNIIAKISLEAPMRLAKRFGKPISSEMLHWSDLAQNLTYLTNESQKLILEHDTYKYGTIIKQADVMMLYYPLQIDTPLEYMQNSQSYYEQVTDADGPAMTWAIYSINWFKLKNIPKAEELFTNNFGYITEPFYVWTEYVNAMGAINFHTGMGGYLQNIVNGFMGVRLEFSGNGKLFISPSISTIICGINLHNLKFQGSSLNVNFSNRTIRLELINSSPLNVFASGNQRNYVLNISNRKLVLATQEIVITST